MKWLCVMLLVLTATPLAAQNNPAGTTVKAKIEAREIDKRLLLERLQADGKDRGLAWQESAAGFDYRILFEIRDETNMRVFWCITKATVRTADGKELFQLTQGGWSCTSAVDSIANAIIERLLSLQPDLPRRKAGA
jgi:hypothetical protein